MARSKSVILVLLVILGFCGSAFAEQTIFVDVDATGANNGQSWADAYASLPYALDGASSGCEIHVAQGTYRPNDGVIGIGDERELTFQLKNGVTVKGGYAGFGEPDPDARDIELYETILSGDLLGNDEYYFINNGENSYHIVNGTGTNSTAVLDGFIITGGNANGSSNNGGVGGGMFMDDYSSPTVLNCTFRGNWAINGGGMFIEEGGTSIIKNCIFSRNSASDYGGGLHGKDECDFKLINCIFMGNVADFGGGMYNYGGEGSRQTLTNCIFYSNSARFNGGGDGGAIFNTLGNSSMLTNCILWWNSPDEIYLNRAIVSYSNIQGGLSGVGNIDVDPLFLDPRGPDGFVGTQDEDFRLSANSPCIDAGDNSAVTVTTDLAGNARIVDTVDMGAYEFQGTHLIYVDVDATGANNGQSWADAYTSLTVVYATYPDEIRVAQGTYRPDTDGLADPREATFAMKNGVIVKGGYAGFGEPDPDARDIELYETILSGDLAANDVPVAKPADLLTEPTRAENCYHVVTSTDTDATAALDGFTITAGMAGSELAGGGLYCASPTVSRCTFRANAAGNGGGVSGGSPTLTDCRFVGNAAYWAAGALDVGGNMTRVANCTFSGNWAGGVGGAVFNFDCSPAYVNCIFSGNTAGEEGGAMRNVDSGGYKLVNCTFIGNTSGGLGGAIRSNEWPTMTNCIFWSNQDSTGMGESAHVTAGGSGEPDFHYCCVQGWTGNWGGTGNIGADPLFVDPNGPDGVVGTEDDDLRLSADSLCIDVGDNSAVTMGTDLDGNERIANNFVDMGAYELQGMHEIYVDDDAVGDPGPDDPKISDPDENGTEAHPFDTIQEAVDIAKNGHAVLVLPGLYVGPDILTQAVSFDKNITLTSIDPTDWNVVEDTIIAGNVSFSGTEDPTCILTGFKIQNAFFGSVLGNGTQAAISNCIITGNGPCLATVINDCDGIISNCLITDNTTFAYCGVFPIVFGCNGVIRNCTIANNISGIGDWSGGSTTLENCIVYNNGEGGDPQVGISGGGTLNVSYCNIQGGSQGIDSDGAVNWGWGNIDVDPQFVRGGLWDYDAVELAEGNYHLQSFGWRLSEYDSDWTYDFVTSRCIDAGNPGSPLADELMNVPRDPDNNFGINLRVNMGAYGGTAQASMAPYNWALLGDLSNDGTVAHEDLIGQAEGWLTSASLHPGDLNRDGIVNMADFAAFARDWLQQTDWAQE